MVTQSEVSVSGSELRSPRSHTFFEDLIRVPSLTLIQSGDHTFHEGYDYLTV